jgi:hypothetical protein
MSLRSEHSPAIASVDEYKVNQIGQKKTRSYTNLVYTDQQTSSFLYDKIWNMY